MGFEGLSTYQFRNLEDADIPLGSKNILFVGENGQGKTNFLEAVYLLCFGSSFRTTQERLFIRHGKDAFRVTGRYIREDGVDLDITVGLTGGKKRVTVDEKEVRDRKDLVKNVPCIVFSHDDIGFINGPPEMKRRFLNQVMSLFNTLYIDLLRRYRKILKMRNALLKEGSFEDIEVYDEQLADTGMEIQRRRGETVEEFGRTFGELFSRISGLPGEARMVYKPSWRRAESRADALTVLEEKGESDREAGFTTSGPHRDRIVYLYEGRDFSDTASTGQLRLMSLILRVAQADYFETKSGRKPVLLLDDVLLELDEAKTESFIAALPAYEQAFFTFLSKEKYRRLGLEGDARVFSVEKGRYTEEAKL
jgi:DNA replication and repair protein RecF